jgi:hypothetical protein
MVHMVAEQKRKNRVAASVAAGGAAARQLLPLSSSERDMLMEQMMKLPNDKQKKVLDIVNDTCPAAIEHGDDGEVDIDFEKVSIPTWHQLQVRSATVAM